MPRVDVNVLGESDGDASSSDATVVEPMFDGTEQTNDDGPFAEEVDTVVPVDTVCVRSCVNRQCGSDGCGGTCGVCPANETCQDDGQCRPCQNGSPCNRGTACETGALRCGSPNTCELDAYSPVGFPCLGGTCDGRGHCSAIEPSFLLIVDSSGSMRQFAGPNRCGYDPSRISNVACALRQLGDRVRDASWGMQTFGLTCHADTPHLRAGAIGGCGTSQCEYGVPAVSPAPDPARNHGYPFPFYGCDDGGKLWIPIAGDNQRALRAWGDGVWTSCTEIPPFGVEGGPELRYVPGPLVNQFNFDVTNWQEPLRGDEVNGTRFTPLAGSLRHAAEYLENHNAEHRSPYVDFDHTGQVDPAARCRSMNIILLTDGEECCPTMVPAVTCTGSQTAVGAALNARNLTCLQVDLNQNGIIENPIANDDPNPSLRGRFEANTDLNGDGDCSDPHEQRAFRTRVHVIGFGVSCGFSAIEAIAEAGGGPRHPVRCGAAQTYGYYVSNDGDFSAAIDSIVANSVVESCVP